MIGQAWRAAREHVTPATASPDEVRRVGYTPNVIEAPNQQSPKAINTKVTSPAEDAARKLIQLAIQNAVPQCTRTPGSTKAQIRSHQTRPPGTRRPRADRAVSARCPNRAPLIITTNQGLVSVTSVDWSV